MPMYGIYHHYLVISVSDGSMSVIHYSGEQKTFTKFGGFAQIKVENLEFESETNLPRLLDFTSGLFLIQKGEYPHTEDEKKTAINRASSRFNENDFRLSSNNCEWFVTWVLTGIGSCEQINNADQGRRALADAIDSTVCERESLLKTFVSKGSALAGPIDAVDTVLKIVLKIFALENQKQDGQIDHHTFKREVTKKVAGTATATAGAMTGAMIGQTIIPIPYVGGVIGFIAGSNAGRLFGSVCSGKLFDFFT